MKKIIFALALTAVFAGVLAGCGQMEGINPAATIDEKTAASAEESKAEETSATEVTTTTAAETSAADSKKEETTTTTTAAAATTTTAAQATTAADTSVVDYQAQYALGLANTAADGRKYAMVPSDGGAGHRYYQTYFSSDNGAAWTEGDYYDEASGDNTHVALDNGDILLFSNHTARGETHPAVFRLTPSGNAIASTQLPDIFEGVYLPDGRLIDQNVDVDCTVNYLGGSLFEIGFTDHISGEDLGVVEMDIGSVL